MIDARREFFTKFFAALEANGVRYCILRNYDNLYADASTDVDMIVSQHSLGRFERCLRESAESSGFHFVHTARYVNYSHVFWHPKAGFVRIDFETEIRWRLFTVLTARQTLDARRRHQEFFIPHPEHESVILFVAAIWRGELSERYRRQLIALYAACTDKRALCRTMVNAFGGVGNILAAFQARAETAPFDAKFCRKVRRHLILRSHLSWSRGVTLVHNTWTDAVRLLERLRQPAGMSFLYVSSHPQARSFDRLMQEINFLFPAKKCVLQSYDLTAEGSAGARWTWTMRWQRLRTMFKGGLYLRAYRVSHDEDLPRVARTHARLIYSRRAFFCVEDSAGCRYFAHVGSGFMSTVERSAGESQESFTSLFIGFISEILKRASLLSSSVSQKGLFCVLVGLDGSGKTTLARNLCNVSTAGERFSGVRYFHWRPKAIRTTEFPLPEYRNTQRKAALQSTALNSVLSSARLVKNVMLAKLVWHLRVASWIDQGYLVLVDRYFYNYLLDPASVKYAGPSWLLARAQKWFPRPEMVVILRTPKEILLQRKQELSPEEIERQVATMETISFDANQTATIDASLPAAEVAHRTMSELEKAASQR